MLFVDIQKQLGAFCLQVRFEAGNEVLALLGASGCGKSVTLKCIAGILAPDQGKIILDGRTLFDSSAGVDLPPQKRCVGYLFQQYALFPNMTVRQNIGAAVAERRKKKQAVDELLVRFRLAAVADLRPHQLSGGQQQRTALARILAARPHVILLDEPFSAADSYLKYQMEMELAEILEMFPGTVLWVSHDRDEVFRNCHRVCVLDQGCSQPTQTLEELFRHPTTEAAAQISGCQNYADAIPRGNAVFLPDWGLALECGRVVPTDVQRIGIRAHHVHLASGRETGAFSCNVVRVVEDIFFTIVLLRPENSMYDAPLLRMEVGKSLWQAAPDKSSVYVFVAPEDIMLL